MVTETASQTTSTYEQFVSLGCGHDLNGFDGSDDTCPNTHAIQEAEQRILDFLTVHASGRDIKARSLDADSDSAPPGP